MISGNVCVSGCSFYDDNVSNSLTVGGPREQGLLAEIQPGQIVLARLEVLGVDLRSALDGHVALDPRSGFEEHKYHFIRLCRYLIEMQTSV